MADQLSGTRTAPRLANSGVLFGHVFFVFTFSDGKVVRWRGYRARAAAVAAARANVPGWR